MVLSQTFFITSIMRSISTILPPSRTPYFIAALSSMIYFPFLVPEIRMHTPFMLLAIIKGLLCTFLTISVVRLLSHPIKWPLLIACLCGLAGDLFLVDDALFMYGLGSFLIGHLAYWLCFHRLGQFKLMHIPAPQRFIVILLIIASMSFLGSYHTRFGELFPAVVIYTVILINMAIQALRIDSTTLISHAVWKIQFGAMCFVVSDLLIAYTFFIATHMWMVLTIWALYALAQLGIVGGCIQIVQYQGMNAIENTD